MDIMVGEMEIFKMNGTMEGRAGGKGGSLRRGGRSFKPMTVQNSRVATLSPGVSVSRGRDIAAGSCTPRVQLHRNILLCTSAVVLVIGTFHVSRLTY